MKHNKRYQRLLAIAMSVVMVLGMMPVSAAAQSLTVGTGDEIISNDELPEKTINREINLGTSTGNLDLPESEKALLGAADVSIASWNDLQAAIDAQNEVIDLSGLTEGPKNPMTFNVGDGKTLTLKGNGTEIQNVAFVFGANNNVTIENLNIKSANDHKDSTTLQKGYSPLYFTGEGNMLILSGTNTITSGQTVTAGPIDILVGYGAAVGVPENAGLTITATDTTTNKLTANGNANGAGIGGGYLETGGKITISGGTVMSTGGSAGIGGGYDGAGGEITISGGTVEAKSHLGAGIGGGYGGAGGIITISDGEVTANGGDLGAGIGGSGSKGGEGGTIIISGGTVKSTGGYDGAGIGGGYQYDGGTITINGGEVTANGGGFGAGIGSGGGSSDCRAGSTITIIDGEVTANGGYGGAGIGGGYRYDGGTITISGGTVMSTGGETAAGIGGGCRGAGGGIITINGGEVTANGGTSNGNVGGAGIGSSGGSGAGGIITISDGEVTAKGGSYGGAGIGGGDGCDGGTITISGGTVMSTGGGNGGAGMGGGTDGKGGDVTISGGMVESNGGSYAAGIGGGRYSITPSGGNGGTVIITGGSVKATAGTRADAIGKGAGGTSPGTLTDGKGNSVYLNTLTISGKGNTIVREATYSASNTYSTTDVKTDANGKLYFYLPVSTGDELMSVKVDAISTDYVAEYTRKASHNNIANLGLSIKGAEITITGSLEYTGSVLEPAVTVKLGDTTLEKDTHYTVSYSGGTNVGDVGKVIITGTGIYAGKVEKAFNITAKQIDGTVSIDVTNGSGDAAKIDEGDTLTLNTNNLIPKDTTYSVEWLRDGIIIGLTSNTYTITQYDLGKTLSVRITGMGEYGGVRNAEKQIPAIVPGAPSLTVYPGNGHVKLNWSVPFDGGSPIIKFELSINNGASWINVGTVTTLLLASLTNGKQYTFKLRAVNKMGNGAEASVNATPTAPPSGGDSGSSGGSPLSGGSPSDGSTDTPATPKEINPNQPVTASAPVTANTGKNRTAKARISDKTITDTIAQAQADAKIQGKIANGIAVKLNITLPKGATSLIATLTRNSLNSLVSAGVTGLSIDGSLVAITFDKKALREIQKQSNGNISITIAPKTKLSASAKKMIGKRSVYDITVSYGSGETVTSFDGGVATVSIKYKPGKKEAVGGLYAVYVDEKGNATRIVGSTYDVNSRSIIFNTTHLSLYGIGYTAPSAKLKDISSHWGKEAIDYVVGRGLLSGISKTTFMPDSAMTRGMLMTALGRLAGVDIKRYTSNSFTDVKADSAYRPYIEWAYSKGIVQSIGGGKFDPEGPITREEIAVIFANYVKATDYKLYVTRIAITYADASGIGSSYKTAVTSMQQAGIMMGGSDNKFNPKLNATRAEVSSMLYRYIKLTIDPGTAQGWALNDAGQSLYYKDGKVLTGTQTIDGVKYFFNADGTLA